MKGDEEEREGTYLSVECVKLGEIKQSVGEEKKLVLRVIFGRICSRLVGWPNIKRGRNMPRAGRRCATVVAATTNN